MDEVLHPGDFGVAARGQAELPARVVVFAERVGVVAGGIGEHVPCDCSIKLFLVGKGDSVTAPLSE